MSVDFFNNDVKLEQPKESVEADSSGKAGQNETIDLFSKEPEDDGIDQIIDKVESEEKAEEVEQPTLKELMAMYGEKEYRVPAEAKFKNKVNGEDVEFTVQEAINSYAGKGGWEKKFSELDKDRQAYKKDLESVNKYLQEFASKAKTDRVGAFEFLAEAVGIDPLEFRKGMRKDLLSKHQDYLSMDEQTRLAYEMKEENEYFKSKHAAELQRRTNEQANLEFEKRMSAVKTEHNISDDKLTELVSDLKEYGGIDKPSLDDIIALNTAYVRQDRAVDILNKVNPELINDDKKLATVESLLAGNPKLDDKELYEYVSKLWGNDVNKAVANLVKKTPNKSASIKTQQYKPKLMASGVVDFFNE